MASANPASTIAACFDDLAAAPYLEDRHAYYELAQSIIDTLGNYPKPREKDNHTKPPRKELAAYLYVSTARNKLKLAQLECVPYDLAFVSAYSCFESALSLLTAN